MTCVQLLSISCLEFLHRLNTKQFAHQLSIRIWLAIVHFIVDHFSVQVSPTTATIMSVEVLLATGQDHRTAPLLRNNRVCLEHGLCFEYSRISVPLSYRSPHLCRVLGDKSIHLMLDWRVVCGLSRDSLRARQQVSQPKNFCSHQDLSPLVTINPAYVLISLTIVEISKYNPPECSELWCFRYSFTSVLQAC